MHDRLFFMKAELKVKEILAKAGVTLNGDKPWDIQIRDPRVYGRVMSGGSLALGESYVEGWWDAKRLDEFLYKVLHAGFTAYDILSWSLLWLLIKSQILNLQSIARAPEVAKKHYDIGNDLYEKMLGPAMAYSCGYWSGTPAANTLEEAQNAKFDLICRKLNLQKGQKLLDVGCGFGTFLEYAARTYGVEATGLTLSTEQAAYARKRTEGLPVTILVQDYRTMTGTFDRIASIGMFEHVGYKNYPTYMKKMYELLAPDGLFLLHSIGSNETRRVGEPWLNTYIFPNGSLPSVAQIGSVIERIFVMEDWHNFGPDYDTTLMAWEKNFEAAWPTLKEKYGEPFYRMWKYYLASCAATFRARYCELWQIVLSKRGLSQYQSVR